MKKRKKQNRYKYNKHLKLLPGEVICKKCKGYGILTVVDVCSRCNNGSIKEPRFCSRCDGDGKFDWIEHIHGKKNIEVKHFHYEEDEIPF